MSSVPPHLRITIRENFRPIMVRFMIPFLLFPLLPAFPGSSAVAKDIMQQAKKQKELAASSSSASH
ncbi:hypothetical protein QOT17_003499 [Balamuthia mandrillaris]